MLSIIVFAFKSVAMQYKVHLLRFYSISIANPEQGFVLLNGVNLRRYWPLAGPQTALHVPKETLRKHRRTTAKNTEKCSNKPIYIDRN